MDYGQLAAISRDERAQLVADAEAVAACLADGVPDCAAAATLLDIVTEAKRYQGKALIAHINRAINLLIRPTPGAWVGALEVLTFADGDCKDYSIPKFFALHEDNPHIAGMILQNWRFQNTDDAAQDALEVWAANFLNMPVPNRRPCRPRSPHR